MGDHMGTVESGQRPWVLGSCVPLRRVKAFAQALAARSLIEL